MEDDLRILKVEYLSNHWSDLTQILNLSLGKWRRLPMEDDLKILKGQWPLIRFFPSYKLKLWGPIKNQKSLKGRQPPMEDNLQFKTKSNWRRTQNITR